MARRASWTELRFGILATVSVLAVAVSILVFGRVGELHGKKLTIYVTSDAARGLVHGSEVWLDGQRVGSVTGVVFRSPATRPKGRLVIALRVLDETRLHIRRNSKVQVRAGTSLIGDQVVYLSSGTLDQPAVVEGDTLRATEQNDMEGVTSEAALAAKEFPGIIENVKLLSAQLKSTEGTLGALGVDDGKMSLQPIRARARRLLANIGESHGTLELMVHNSGEWRAAAVAALASADSIRALATSNGHSLGRFRRDSTLALDVAAARSALVKLQQLAASPDGTVGRVRADSAIVLAVGRGRLALDSLMQDMKRHPLRYIAF